LTVFFNKRDERHRGSANRCSEFREVVEGLLRKRVEDVILPEHLETFSFVGRNGDGRARFGFRFKTGPVFFRQKDGTFG